jgi:Domain of unknown function (DUF5047)
MRPASDHFREAVRESHVIAAACTLIFPDGQTADVPVEGGQVTIDRTARHRRTGSVQIPWSLNAGEDLGLDLRTLPLGGYALVSRGLRFADGTLELILLGRLRVESVTWDTLAAAASLELADRMAQVADEPFTTPYAAAGQLPADAAIAIVEAVFGDAIGYSAPFAPPDAMGDTIYTGQRTDALSALEQSYGAETYFDADGDFVFAEKPGDDEAVVWDVDAGAAGVMVNANENLDRTGIYNGVLVTGQPAADAPPITALATFDEPGSPIAWGGPFGKVALLVDGASVTTPEQAAATAQSLLRLRLKQTRSLTLTAAPNPALEAGDTIRVAFPDGRDETHLVDAVTTSLRTDAQQILTRTAAAPLGDEAPTVGFHYARAAWREAADARMIMA